jgi:hypothetical protein
LAELYVVGRDNGADAFTFRENKKIAFHRSVAAARPIFLRRSEPLLGQKRSGGERGQKKRASRLLRTPHLSSPALSLDLSRM